MIYMNLISQIKNIFASKTSQLQSEFNISIFSDPRSLIPLIESINISQIFLVKRKITSNNPFVFPIQPSTQKSISNSYPFLYIFPFPKKNIFCKNKK